MAFKKKDKIFVAGKKRAEYSEGYTPTTEGEIVSVNKDTVSILWAGTGIPVEIPKASIIEKEKADKNGEEIQLHKIERTNKKTRV